MESVIEKLGKVSVTVEKDYHSSEKEYNKLTIVEEQGAFKTYISRKPVPVGVALTNREYWICFSGVLESITFDYLKFKRDYASGNALKDNSIITRHILDRNIERIKIALKAISEEEIDDDAIIERTIKDRNITSNKIAQENILTEHFAKKSVITAILADYAITAIKLADNSVITRAIANENVTKEKLSIEIQSLINNLSKTFTFAGIATPITNPGIPDAKLFYIATKKGTYINFNNINVIDDEFTILYWDSSWHKISIGIVSQKKFTELNEKVNSLALGKFYGYFPDSSSLPIDVTISGYAYVGLDTPYKIWNFNGKSWSDSGTSIDMNDADEEDITRNTEGKLQFKDRSYGDGMGYVILRKDKAIAEQVIQANTIYEIRYDFYLEGEKIEIPANCVLNFNGGKIINGTIEHNNCAIISSTTCFEDIIFSSTYNKQINAMWFGVLPSNSSNASILNKLFTFCINVFLPVGVYNIEDELILDGAIKQFHGSVDVSRTLTKLNFSSTNGFVVKTRCSISNFVVNGNNCIGTYDASQGIYLNGKLGIDVRIGCFIDNCVVSKFMVGLNIVSGHIITSRFNNIVVQENSNYGLCLVHTGIEQKNNLSFNLIYAVNNGYDALNRKSDSTLEASGIGIYIKGGYANSFTNCVCEYNSGVGLLVASPSGENLLSGNLFSAIYTERNKYANILIYVTNRAANEVLRNNVFKSLFHNDAGYALVSNANKNRGVIIKPYNLIVGRAYNAIYASFEINNISNKLIADYVSQMGVDIDLLGKMGITEDEAIVIKKDAKGYYIDLSSDKKTITIIGVLSLLKFKRGIYRIFVAAQSYNITSTSPSIYFGLTINGTLHGKTKQILSTEDFVTNLGVYYFSQENNNISIDNSYITNASSLPSDFNIRLRKIYFEEIKSLTSVERNSITLDSNMVGYRVFDSTLGKDVVWSGSKWIDAIGADV